MQDELKVVCPFSSKEIRSEKDQIATAVAINASYSQSDGYHLNTEPDIPNVKDADDEDAAAFAETLSQYIDDALFGEKISVSCKYELLQVKAGELEPEEPDPDPDAYQSTDRYIRHDEMIVEISAVVSPDPVVFIRELKERIQ